MEDGSWERKDTLKFEDDGELAFLEHLSPILGLCLHFLSFAVTWRWARMHTSSALYSFFVHLSSCIPPPSLVKNFFREMCSIVVVRLNASLYTPFVWKSLPPSLLNPDFFHLHLLTSHEKFFRNRSMMKVSSNAVDYASITNSVKQRSPSPSLCLSREGIECIGTTSHCNGIEISRKSLRDKMTIENANSF